LLFSPASAIDEKRLAEKKMMDKSINSVGIVVNPSKALAREVLPEFIPWLTKKGLQVVVVRERELDFCDPSLFISPETLASKSDMVIAMGGDGTLLRAARYILTGNIPLVGVNLGSLGFLTEIVVDELYPVIEKILSGDYRIEERSVLKSTLATRKSYYALNDMVLHMGTSGRIITIEIAIDGSPLALFSADGLIISTPTGSTAYSLAAGGPILHHGVDAQILTPISPHTLGLRPMIFASEELLTITLRKGEGMFVVDGQTAIETEKGFSFTVTKAESKIHLVRATDRDFYEILRTKLNWGGV
jgi:NAD+ kinase